MKEEITTIQELLEISPAVANQPKSNLFEVPGGYFSNFPQRILKRIEVQSLEGDQPLPSILEELKNENPFSVPEGYFKQFSPFKATSETPVVQLSVWKKATRILVAACVAGLIMLVINLNENQPKDFTGTSVSVEAANIPESTLEGYLNDLELIDNELDKTVVLQDVETILIDIDLQTISEVLKEISENDISLYLEQAG